MGERNESKIIIEGKQTRALIDSGAQLSLITTTYAKHLGLPIKKLRSSFRVEGAGGIDVPYKGFVEAQISIPEIRGFDEPCLLLVSGDSEFGHICPVILGTLHIDMILEKATKEELQGLSESWRRGGLGNRVMNQLAAVSGELDRCTGEVRVTRDIHVGEGETVQVSGRSDHPLNCKRVNVILEPLETPEGALVVRTYAMTKSNGRRVPLIFRNLSGRKQVIKKGTRVAKLSPANKVPRVMAVMGRGDEEELLHDLQEEKERSSQSERSRRAERSTGALHRSAPDKSERSGLSERSAGALHRSAPDYRSAPPERSGRTENRGKSPVEAVGLLDRWEELKANKEMELYRMAQATIAPDPERLERLFSKIDLSGCEGWSDDLRTKCRDLIVRFQHIFALEDKELGCTSLVKHKIRLTDDTPFKERPRRVPPQQYEEVKKHLDAMLEVGAIRRSCSPWASAVVLVRKKSGELRFCIDLRKLNNRTIKDAYALPRIEDSLDSLNGACIFTSLDLISGYWQVELDEASIPLTAFTVGPLGFYECCRMPFGLCNAPATFQRLMESCLGELHLQQCIIYLDDIIVFAKSPEEHLNRLEGVLLKLQAAGLKLKPSKCDFFKEKITYLGHVVSKEGIATDNEKVRVIKEWPVPKTVTEVRSFLGFTNYYRKFIYKYAHVARPLNELISGENAKYKKRKVQWSDACQSAFEKLKEICSETPILAYADYSKDFRLNTDASELGLGAVLYQVQDDGLERVIGFASRSLTKPERNYDAHRLEFLALKWAVTEKFHEYLYGGKFEVYTDNNPLTYILTSAKLDATGHRWVAALACYDFKLFYRVGKSNADADALSRIPWQMCEVKEMVLPMWERLKVNGQAIPQLPMIPPVLVVNLIIDNSYKLSKKDWQFEQGADPDIGVVMDLLVHNKKCDKDASRGVKIFWKLRNQLEFKNGLLYRKVYSKRQGKHIYQFVLPEKFRKRTLTVCHDDYGHLGEDRVVHLLQDRYFWPKMLQDVKTHLQECDRCLKFKQPMEKAPMHPLWITYPFELIHLDFLQIGNTKNILVITDHFTRFAAAFITPSGSAKAVARVLCYQFFPFYTWPDKILTDQGGCFESQLYKEILAIAQIGKVRTTPYHPSTNGQCERFNRTLIAMIGTLPSEVKCSWEDWVATLCHAYNCTVSGVTGYSPYYLMFGRLPRLPIDIEYDVGIDETGKSYTKYAQDLVERLREAHERAQELIEKESNRQKGYYDKNVRCALLKKGDLVLLRVLRHGIDHKIADRWETPIYKVIKQLGDKPAYQIQNTETLALKTVHRNYLYPLRLRKEGTPLASQALLPDEMLMGF